MASFLNLSHTRTCKVSFWREKRFFCRKEHPISQLVNIDVRFYFQTGDEIMEINGQDVSSMKLQRLQEIFRKKFQAASWNRVRQYHLSITVRRQRIVTATQTNTATTSCTSATATSPRTQSWGVVQQQQQQEIHSSNRWN